jgi:hypothetical protein
MKKIYVAHDSQEAHLLAGFLESEGVSAEIRGETVFGPSGVVPFGDAFPTVWVVDESEDEARRIIGEHGG